MISTTRISGNNSTSTALAGSGTFTGEWEDGDGYTELIVSVKSDVAGTFYVDFSTDGTNADSQISKAVAAATNELRRLDISKRFFRVRYVNGSSAQSYLRLQTRLNRHGSLLTSARNSSIRSDADTIIARAIDWEFDIAAGLAQGVTIVNKFGRNPAVSTADVPEDVWNGGGVYTGFPTGSAELVTVVSSSSDDTNSNGAGARSVRLFGLDANGYEQTEDVNLAGQTPVDSVNTWKRIYRVKVLTSGSSNQAFNVGTITVAHKVTTANVFAVMPVATNQTTLGIYTVPTGKTAYLRKLDVRADRANSVTINGALWVRENGFSPRLVRPFTITNTVDDVDIIYGGIVLPALTDIAVRITYCSANNVAITTNFDMIVADA